MKIKIRQINDEQKKRLFNKNLSTENVFIKLIFEVEINERVHLDNRVNAGTSTVTDIVIDDDFVIEAAAEVHSDGTKLKFAKYIEEDELKLLIRSLVKK